MKRTTFGTRCRFYDENGNPINGGCWHGKGCWYIHPGTPGWELPGQSTNNTRPSASTSLNTGSVETEIFGDIGSTKGKDSSGGLGAPPRSWGKQRQSSDWGNPPPAPANNSSGWGKFPPAPTNNNSGWGSPPPAPANNNSGWESPPPAHANRSSACGELLKDSTSVVAKQVAWASEWGQPPENPAPSGVWRSPSPTDVRMEEVDQTTPSASKTNVVDHGWGMLPSHSASIVSPASTSTHSFTTSKSRQTASSRASYAPPPLPYQAKLVSSSVQLPDTTVGDPDDLLEELEGDSNNVTELYAMRIFAAVTKQQRLIAAEKTYEDRNELKEGFKNLFKDFAPRSSAANQIEEILAQDKTASNIRQEYRKALRKIVDLPKKFGNPNPPQAQYDPSSDIVALTKNIDELRRDVELIKASDTTVAWADKLRALEERVTRIQLAKEETFDGLHGSSSEGFTIASRDDVVPASYTGSRNVDAHHEELEQLISRDGEQRQRLENLRRDVAKVSETVKELKSQKTSLLAERQKLLEREERLLLVESREMMRENSAIINEMQRKIDALYSQPPVAPPSLDAFKEEVSATLEAQMRQDLQAALEELRRGVVDHFGVQQSHLTQQVWRKLQPAMQIVQSAHHFTDIEKCRASSDIKTPHLS